MKRIAPVPEHPDWQKECLDPGAAWAYSNPGAARPRDYWTGRDRKFNRHLAAGVGELCSYTATWAPNGQMDHYEPWARLRGTAREIVAYEWTNFRYACEWFNKAKGSADVPDPHVVEDDWFQLLLPSLELVATDRVPPSERARVENVLRWLGRDDRALATRRAYWRAWLDGEITLSALYRWAPLLADAIARHPELEVER